MIHKERTNCNWLCKDQPQSRLPVLKKIAPCNAPTSNYTPSPDQINDPVIDDYFIESTAQYKNIYIQLAKRYTQRINNDEGCEKILDDNSLARRILTITINKIEDLEKRKDNSLICREMVKAIGELASQYIDLALENNKTGKLLELFNEALNRILRSKNSPEINKTPECHRNAPRCILEHLEAASDSSSSSSSRSNGERKLFRLIDWSGDDTHNREKGSDSATVPEWIWSERSTGPGSPSL